MSAKRREGLDDLLEAIVLVADTMDIRANPNGEVIGTVIEAELDKAKGVDGNLAGAKWHPRSGGCCHRW